MREPRPRARVDGHGRERNRPVPATHTKPARIGRSTETPSIHRPHQPAARAQTGPSQNPGSTLNGPGLEVVTPNKPSPATIPTSATTGTSHRRALDRPEPSRASTPNTARNTATRTLRVGAPTPTTGFDKSMRAVIANSTHGRNDQHEVNTAYLTQGTSTTGTSHNPSRRTVGQFVN